LIFGVGEMAEKTEVLIIGAGQAGLAASYELSRRGIEHMVLERDRIGQSWRTRWNSFCLVTPNWFIQLPGGAYDGPEPDGYMPRDAIVAHLERYAASFHAPVREGVEVTSVVPRPAGLLVRTSAGDLSARAVVVATGTYRRPYRPANAESFPASVRVIDACAYRDPESLPAGGVLVVGSGQTGCQIAEELHGAGREVVVACGRAPWAPRRVDGRDIVRWLVETPFLDQKVADLPTPAARLIANVQTTGQGGGYDLHYRVLQARGVTLAGHLLGVEDGRVQFAPDLAQSVAFGDDRYRDLRKLLRAASAKRGRPAPNLPDPEPFVANPPAQLDLDQFRTVIFTAGFRPDYASWIAAPAGFDELGFPDQVDGASAAVPGLYFLGTHFLRTRKSALLAGIGGDAAVVVAAIVNRLADGALTVPQTLMIS
jgi:putative flavoprotein involved in K+ transport